MSYDYGPINATARRLIAKFGRAAILRVPGQISGPSYDPIPGADIDHPVAIVDDGTTRDADGATITTRRRLLLSTEGLNVVPTVNDFIVMDGQAHSIARVQPTAPGDAVVMYEVLLDR